MTDSLPPLIEPSGRISHIRLSGSFIGGRKSAFEGVAGRLDWPDDNYH